MPVNKPSFKRTLIFYLQENAAGEIRIVLAKNINRDITALELELSRSRTPDIVGTSRIEVRNIPNQFAEMFESISKGGMDCAFKDGYEAYNFLLSTGLRIRPYR